MKSKINMFRMIKIRNTYKTRNYSPLVLIAITSMLIGFMSCKKDRIVQDDYQDMDSFYNQHKEAEQEYVIDSGGVCPLIAKKETKLCVSDDMFQLPNGTGITYPFTLKVVELYSIKDMLLWRAPSVASGSLLETSAEIRVRSFQNNVEAALKPAKTYGMEMDTMPVLNSSMQPYKGQASGNVINWSIDGLTTVSVNPYFYSLSVGTTGWMSAARLHPSTQTTTIAFSATGTNTQNIEIYLKFNSFKGLMKVTNLVSGSIPVGESVTLVAMAKNQNNDYVLHQQTFTVTAGQQITLNLQVISEASLLAALDAL